MFFDVNIFGIHKNGSFSKCWLAATNPKLFKSFVLRGEMDKIGISTLCDEMREELTTGLSSSNHRMPLYFAAQLVYGAVRIYQQQVETLYEKANHLFFFQNATLRELMLKRPRISDENYHGKKQRLPFDLAEDAKQYEIDLPDTKGENVCELLCHDSQAGQPQDFLIREESKEEVIIVDDDEGFGIINEIEMRNLLDVLRTEEDKPSEDTKSIGNNLKNLISENVTENKKEKNTVQDSSRDTLNKNTPAENLDSELHQEVDMIREAIQDEEPNPLMLSFPDILDPNISIQIDESTIQNMRSFGLQPQLMENVDTAHDQPTAIVVPDQPGQLDELPLIELIRSKRKRKIVKLKIDTCTKITYDDFIKQFDYSKTLRCFTPRMDIVPPYKMNLKNSNMLFGMPSSNLAPKQLLKAFKRNLKTKATDVDAKILDDIVGIESGDLEEVCPAIRRNPRQAASCPRNDSNRSNQADEPLAALLPPFDVTNALEITTNALEPVYQSDIIQKNSLFSESENCVEDSLYLRLKDDLLQDFEGIKDRQEDSNALASEMNLYNSGELNRSQLGKELVIKRLLHLWKNKVETITMKLLCHGVHRKDAAYAFLCLLELRARQYVELKRDTETNEISNIEMGLKVLGRLNGTFK